MITSRIDLVNLCWWQGHAIVLSSLQQSSRPISVIISWPRGPSLGIRRGSVITYVTARQMVQMSMHINAPSGLIYELDKTDTYTRHFIPFFNVRSTTTISKRCTKWRGNSRISSCNIGTDPRIKPPTLFSNYHLQKLLAPLVLFQKLDVARGVHNLPFGGHWLLGSWIKELILGSLW